MNIFFSHISLHITFVERSLIFTYCTCFQRHTNQWCHRWPHQFPGESCSRGKPSTTPFLLSHSKELWPCTRPRTDKCMTQQLIGACDVSTHRRDTDPSVRPTKSVRLDFSSKFAHWKVVKEREDNGACSGEGGRRLRGIWAFVKQVIHSWKLCLWSPRDLGSFPGKVC